MNTFRIKKVTGTYSELLETYGLANFLKKIFDREGCRDVEINIEDRDTFFDVTVNKDITDEMIERVHYFSPFKYIKKKADLDVSAYPDCYDYPLQKKWKKERNEELQRVYKEFQGKEKKEERERQIKEIETRYDVDVAHDVYSQICTPNNSPSFDKLFRNFYHNQEMFPLLVKEILAYYSEHTYDSKGFEKQLKGKSFAKDITATQLYNPSQGQGLNKLKADGLNRKNFDSSWVAETMKISGALSDMVCQLVKVGSSYDLKVAVPEYKRIGWENKRTLMSKFKKYLKGNTPIKIDILDILLLTEQIIDYTAIGEETYWVDDIVTGLHTVYQKDLGQNKAVVNIGFLQVPDFIEIGTEDKKADWLEILEEQRKIIGNIDELGSTIQGLMWYRDFISGSDLNSFFRFSFWYGAYLSNQLSNKKYARAFTVESLNKFYMSMDTKLREIVENKGFVAVAKAIRQSTVNLQYTPKENRKYEVRYGVAQTLQVKSKTPEDLAEYIGEFVAAYNAETARQTEKSGQALRANVREDELTEFYALLDRFSSKLVGAMLASYGFALSAKKQEGMEGEGSSMEESEEE